MTGRSSLSLYVRSRRVQYSHLTYLLQVVYRQYSHATHGYIHNNNTSTRKRVAYNQDLFIEIQLQSCFGQGIIVIFIIAACNLALVCHYHSAFTVVVLRRVCQGY